MLHVSMHHESLGLLRSLFMFPQHRQLRSGLDQPTAEPGMSLVMSTVNCATLQTGKLEYGKLSGGRIDGHVRLNHRRIDFPDWPVLKGCESRARFVEYFLPSPWLCDSPRDLLSMGSVSSASCKFDP